MCFALWVYYSCLTSEPLLRMVPAQCWLVCSPPGTFWIHSPGVGGVLFLTVLSHFLRKPECRERIFQCQQHWFTEKCQLSFADFEMNFQPTSYSAEKCLLPNCWVQIFPDRKFLSLNAVLAEHSKDQPFMQIWMFNNRRQYVHYHKYSKKCQKRETFSFINTAKVKKIPTHCWCWDASIHWWWECKLS